MRVLTVLRTLWAALARGDEYARFRLAEGASRALYPRYVFSEYGRTFLDDEDFREVFLSVEDNTRSLDRKFVLDQLVALVAAVPGDTAECGVLHGASSLLVCRRIAGTGKRHHVFDSFEGLSRPSAEDGDAWAEGDLTAAEETVQRNLAAYDFVEYHRGWIPERFPDVADRRFSFVHVDVDLYQPTRDSLAFFYERMAPGGLILSDDYGFRSCPGARTAFDEFMADRPEPVVELPTGQAFVLRAAPVPAALPSSPSGADGAAAQPALHPGPEDAGRGDVHERGR
jgi:hypothetical protein